MQRGGPLEKIGLRIKVGFKPQSKRPSKRLDRHFSPRSLIKGRRRKEPAYTKCYGKKEEGEERKRASHKGGKRNLGWEPNIEIAGHFGGRQPCHMSPYINILRLPLRRSLSALKKEKEGAKKAVSAVDRAWGLFPARRRKRGPSRKPYVLQLSSC